MKLVDPFNFTKFDRSDAELEAMILFCVMVANKRADQTYAKLEKFLCGSVHPFAWVRSLLSDHCLLRYLKRARIGQYKRIQKAFRGVIWLNLRTCTVDNLEAIHGIGPKTARMFLLHSRPKQWYAVLDTHVLHWLKAEGVPNVPKSTPPAGKTYRRLESDFLARCDHMGVDPATLDLRIWNSRTKSKVTA